MGIVRRWLRRLKFWLAVQALPILDPEFSRSLRHAERQIRDANEMIRRRHGWDD